MTVSGYRRLLFPAGLATAAFFAYSLSLRANDGDSYATEIPLIGGTRYVSGIVAWLAAAWFCARLLENDSEVLRLTERNPFPAHAPKYLRAMLYRYRFSGAEARRREGLWWTRELVGDYSPVLSLPDRPRPRDSGR